MLERLDYGEVMTKKEVTFYLTILVFSVMGFTAHGILILGGSTIPAWNLFWFAVSLISTVVAVCAIYQAMEEPDENE